MTAEYPALLTVWVRRVRRRFASYDQPFTVVRVANERISVECDCCGIYHDDEEHTPFSLADFHETFVPQPPRRPTVAVEEANKKKRIVLEWVVSHGNVRIAGDGVVMGAKNPQKRPSAVIASRVQALAKAGLLIEDKHGYFTITEAGTKFLKEK